MAGEKNSKYKPEYDELVNSSLMTIDQVMAIGSKRKGISCVYGFFDGDVPVYFGKTINSKRRFECYSSAKCHNASLNNFISKNRSKKIVKILECKQEDLLNIETYLIESNFDSLFNISKNKAPSWIDQNKTKKPWIAKAGILCPTSVLLRSLSDENLKEKIRSHLKTLSDKERCMVEIEQARFSKFTEERFSSWLDFVSPRMIECLEA